MDNQIIKYKDDGGGLVQFTADDVRRTICSGATDAELAMFIETCNRQRLNPLTKEAYLVKYGNQPAQMIVSYQVLNRRANTFEDYRGIESGVVLMTRDGRIIKRRGAAAYKVAGEQLIGGWAEVWRAGMEHSFYAELALTDYSTGKSNWAKMPGVMIEKCAKAAAWRLAFPAEFAGMYTSEEMEQAAEPVRVQAQATPVRDLAPVRGCFRAFATATGLTAEQATSAILAHAGVPSMDEVDDPEAVAAWMRGVVQDAQEAAYAQAESDAKTEEIIDF